MIGRPLLAGLSAVPVAVLTATPAVAWLTDSVQIGTAVLVLTLLLAITVLITDRHARRRVTAA